MGYNKYQELFSNGTLKTWGFTHTANNNRLAIAHITHTKKNGDQLFEWAVVRNPNFEEGYWSHAVAYCMTYEEAKEIYLEKTK